MSEENILARLPPLPNAALMPHQVDARKQAREQKDAAIRSVSSIDAMREAIKFHARSLPVLTQLPRFHKLDAKGFRQQAALGLPFLITGIVGRWPLSTLPADVLRQDYSELPVRARVGDYVENAFALDRPMRDMRMGDYLDLIEAGSDPLPPYLGNLELRELNRLCHWPAYFDKLGPPRFWIGPARCVTPLHCDFDDNIFAQIWGHKRIVLAPPHHDAFLYVREANPLLFGSPVDPESPDFIAFPLAQQAAFTEFIIEPGEMLYVPAGWFHQVRALSFSLSSNRWARAMPLALQGDASLRRVTG